MQHDLHLLEELGENCQMGIRTIDQLLTMMKEPAFIQQLQKQLCFYKEFWEDVRRELIKRDADEKVFSAFEKMKTDVMLSMSTAIDRTVSHVAEMLIIGSTRGIVQLERNLRRYPDASPEIVEMERQLMKQEEKNVDALRCFLD